MIMSWTKYIRIIAILVVIIGVVLISFERLGIIRFWNSFPDEKSEEDCSKSSISCTDESFAEENVQTERRDGEWIVLPLPFWSEAMNVYEGYPIRIVLPQSFLEEETIQVEASVVGTGELIYSGQYYDKFLPDRDEQRGRQLVMSYPAEFYFQYLGYPTEEKDRQAFVQIILFTEEDGEREYRGYAHVLMAAVQGRWVAVLFDSELFYGSYLSNETKWAKIRESFDMETSLWDLADSYQSPFDDDSAP